MKMTRQEFEEYLKIYMYYLLDKVDTVYYDEVKKSLENLIKNILINCK